MSNFRRKALSKAFFLIILSVFLTSYTFGGPKLSSLPNGLYAVIKTNKGDLTLSLEYKKAPLTVANFVGLAEGKMKSSVKSGKFYDGVIFHRIIKDFMIQGGDPQGNGTGGPGYKFIDEFDPTLTFDKAGILAMANSGPGTNGSQFFITLAATAWLNNKHTIFGHVVDGLDLLKTLGTVKTGAQDKPVEPITIQTIEIIRKGSEAEAFAGGQDHFDKLNAANVQKQKDAKAKAEKESSAAIKKLLPDAQKTESGIYYTIVKKGTGEKVKAGQMVTVHYTGKLLDGTTFDSSKGRQPIEIPAGGGQVIPGWDQTLVDMRVGEVRKIILPPNLGYGERGYPGVIPESAYLYFEMEIVSAK